MKWMRCGYGIGLLRRSASEYGRLRYRDGGHEGAPAAGKC
jgi:hypothetical protein